MYWRHCVAQHARFYSIVSETYRDGEISCDRPLVNINKLCDIGEEHGGRPGWYKDEKEPEGNIGVNDHS